MALLFLKDFVPQALLPHKSPLCVVSCVGMGGKVGVGKGKGKGKKPSSSS